MKETQHEHPLSYSLLTGKGGRPSFGTRPTSALHSGSPTRRLTFSARTVGSSAPSDHALGFSGPKTALFGDSGLEDQKNFALLGKDEFIIAAKHVDQLVEVYKPSLGSLGDRTSARLGGRRSLASHLSSRSPARRTNSPCHPQTELVPCPSAGYSSYGSWWLKTTGIPRRSPC